MSRYLYYNFLINISNLMLIMGSWTDDYYWRDYDGTVPEDALTGGLDGTGRPMYIAQVLFENKLVVGKVFENENSMRFGWGHERTATDNVKVLCTKNPDNFEWVPTKLKDITRLTGKQLIVGGTQPGLPYTYIGRTFTNGGTIIGKFACNERDCLGLYTTNDGKEIRHTDADIEVLAYRSGLADNNVNCINE